ncbi:phage tail tube protein [Pseudomonas panipatensis]|uniref:phage tail tube protein n=1 Tax=Pseudomonas panipatensis TaxID=428992 RepID=UPI0035AEC98F
MSKLFSFQGKVFAGDRLANGTLSRPVWAGNVPAMSLKLSTDSTNKTESFSGKRLQYGRLQKGTTAQLDITFDEWLPKNIALAIWATQVTLAADTVTAESLEASLVAGDYVKLDGQFISSLVLTDSAGTPATLVEGTNYRIESVNSGLIELLDVTSLTQPFKAAYATEAATAYTMFTAAPPERYILLDGVNTETDEPVVVTLYRCKFDPVSDLGFINDDYGNFQLSGSVLYDELNAADAELGGFGRIVQKSEA